MHHRSVKDRKMTAMMVIGNIETFAEHLEQCATHMGWNDTLATYLLDIPVDTLDLIAPDSLLPYINNVTAYYTLNHDKSAENIFSNSIDTWKNIGNFEFIENAGQCFADINNIKDIYDDFLNIPNRIRERMIKNLDACPGKSLASKVLQDREYRNQIYSIYIVIINAVFNFVFFANKQLFGNVAVYRKPRNAFYFRAVLRKPVY